MPSPLVVLLFLMSKISLNFSLAPCLTSLSLCLSLIVTSLLQISLSLSFYISFLPSPPFFLLRVSLLFTTSALSLSVKCGSEGGNYYCSRVSISAFLMSLSNKHTHTHTHTKVIISEKLNLAKCHQGRAEYTAANSAAVSHLVKTVKRDIM